MLPFSTAKQKNFPRIWTLVAGSAIIGLFATLMTLLLKRATEHYENVFFNVAENQTIYFILFPITGLSLIHLLRHYLFKKKENKGITEVLESTNSVKKDLPAYKIPSHFINGFLTVIFGGSTGIEVSTVVGSAAIGSVAQQKRAQPFPPPQG